jgi:hypothetical protein
MHLIAQPRNDGRKRHASASSKLNDQGVVSGNPNAELFFSVEFATMCRSINRQ